MVMVLVIVMVVVEMVEMAMMVVVMRHWIYQQVLAHWLLPWLLSSHWPLLLTEVKTEMTVASTCWLMPH